MSIAEAGGPDVERILNVIAEIAGLPREEVTADALFVDDLGLDSLVIAEVVVVLIDEMNMHELAAQLQTRDWSRTSAAALVRDHAAGCRDMPINIADRR